MSCCRAAYELLAEVGDGLTGRRRRIVGVFAPPLLQQRSDHPSNNLAKLPFDPSVRVPRTRLRLCYGDGFDGAPLMGRRPRGEGRAVGGGADDPARPATPASAGAGES